MFFPNLTLFIIEIQLLIVSIIKFFAFYKAKKNSNYNKEEFLRDEKVF